VRKAQAASAPNELLADLRSEVAAMSFISTMENCTFDDFLRDTSAAQNVRGQSLFALTNAVQLIEGTAAGGAGGQLTAAGCLLRTRGRLKRSV
jgi:hypothetical protein